MKMNIKPKVHDAEEQLLQIALEEVQHQANCVKIKNGITSLQVQIFE